jgi:hypothetical protein
MIAAKVDSNINAPLTSNMTPNEYLKTVLELQNLADDSDEMKELQAHRADVEALLRNEFADCSPTIRYGGSKAKGTLIKESYDLDVICYFPSEDTSAGSSLEEIYNNVRRALEKKYYVTPKTSALRLKSNDPKTLARDFHIDVVPGRYVDGADGDSFIYQAGAEKQRLKTNLDVHINHVRKSGVVDAIKLQKLWKTRRGLQIKQFIWELLIIKLLRGKGTEPLSSQLEQVWAEIRDSEDPMSVEDPANPSGNDLSGPLTAAWQTLRGAADATLATLGNSGWEAVFGTTKRPEVTSRVEILTKAAASANIITKPWSPR